MSKFHCWRCNKEVKQLPDGSGGFEVGIAKWFTSLEPWEVQVPICRTCYMWLSNELSLGQLTNNIEKQKPRNH